MGFPSTPACIGPAFKYTLGGVRSIGQVQGAANARAFCDYLYVQGIRAEVDEESDGGHAVWVHEEDKMDVATRLLAEFNANPANSKFTSAARRAEEQRAADQAKEAAYRKKVRGARSLFPGLTGNHRPRLALALVIACTAVFGLSKFATDFSRVAGLFISDPDLHLLHLKPLVEVRSGQIWRLFTPALLHFSLAHIFFNMMWVLNLGGLIESREGTGRLALLCLVIAGASNVAQYFVSGASFGGMSGVVYGLFGYAWIRGKFDPGSGLGVDHQNVVMMLIWFVVCFTGWVGPIANTVHTVGLVIGVVWGWLASQRR